MPSNSDKEVGSKTVVGLTYLELRLLNIQRLGTVSLLNCQDGGIGTYKVGDHDLGFAAACRSWAGRNGLRRLNGLGVLLDAANGGLSSSRAASAAAAGSATASA